MRPAKLLRETVTLKDERAVVLRPIDPDDAALLIAFHERLSFESQYYRFFGPKPKLTEDEAAYLANVDFHKRFAIVAVVDEPDGPCIVAVGRFDVTAPRVAEAAIVVRDDYQGAGLGSALLLRMREIGRGAGLRAFAAEILVENTRMIDLLSSNDIEVSPEQAGLVKVTAPIDQPIIMQGFTIATDVVEALLRKTES